MPPQVVINNHSQGPVVDDPAIVRKSVKFHASANSNSSKSGNEPPVLESSQDSLSPASGKSIPLSNLVCLSLARAYYVENLVLKISTGLLYRQQRQVVCSLQLGT